MLKAIYDKKEDIPSGYEALYTERNGKWELSKIEGIKTEADVARVSDALNKEREEHKAIKEKFKPLLSYDVTDVVSKLDNYDALKIKADSAGDEKKLEEVVAARLNAAINPIKREAEEAKNKLIEAETLITAFKSEKQARTLEDHVKNAATKAKIVSSAIEDVVLYAKNHFEILSDGKVVTKDGGPIMAGLTPETWLTEIAPQKPHWFGGSQSGGASGSGGAGGVNPFTAKDWNLTEQGKLIKTNSTLAANLAKAAGTSVGGGKPKQ